MKEAKSREKGFEDEYKRLNFEQKRAVDAIEGPVLVIAGPGSGKTQILSLRVANILQQTDTRPANILCLTFTDSAASNMRERLARLIGQPAYRVCINTFHGFATDVISRYPEYFYSGATFMPADDLSQLEVLEELFLAMTHDDPLRKEHPEQGFVYLRSARKAIAELKKAGISPEEFSEIIEHNAAALVEISKKLKAAFPARLTKADIEKLAPLPGEIRSVKNKRFPVEHMRPIADIVADSLSRALRLAAESDATAPLSAWKQSWLKKDDAGEIGFKDSLYLDKMRSLAGVYAGYAKEMHERGYFDFDDMLIDVISALENRKSLRSELQEQYQYILVDEFQDTNDAQLRLLKLLASAEAQNGQPNIMAVGDDDQAIYKFQGAEASNMISFRRLFGDPQMVVLKSNYRSTQEILDIAREVIQKGEERLEKLIPELSKELVAAGMLAKGTIESHAFPSSAHEYAWIAAEVKKRLGAGTPAREIAIIARTHRVLEEIVPFLHEQGVPVAYERQQNVFEEPHIRELIVICRFLASLAGKKAEADEFLPEILSFPFWNIPRKTIWQISMKAYRERKLWIDIMLEHEDAAIKAVAELFLELAGEAKHLPLERLLDKIIGSHVDLSAVDDEDEIVSPSLNLAAKLDLGGSFVSPFKDYYFSKDKFKNNRLEYLTFLSSLRAFVEALREYRRGKRVSLADFISFVDLHDKHGILVTDQSPFANSLDAVALLTAHKAKGLEFDAVYVASCQEEVWAGRGRGSILPFPINLPIAPAGDTDDDHLRLFYVALTRAKRHLIITSYEMSDRGGLSMPLRFLTNAIKPAAFESKEALPETHHVLISAWEAYNRPPYVYDEEAILKKALEEYRMSVTHLNNYLDVTRGGPRVFLETNLLQFPQSKSPSAAYGTAMHAAVERIYSHVRTEGKKPAVAKIVQWFEEALARERLGDQDFARYLRQGEAALRAYWEAKKTSIDETARIETNFAQQGVMIGRAALSGKIDKVTKAEDGSLIVADFKTGMAVADWKGHSDSEKNKLYRYRRQLLFYKILIENARDFEDSRVSRGVLEFLEPMNGKIYDLALDIPDDEVRRLEKLIEIVYAKIRALDFPDTSNYSPDLKGVMAFEEDLLTAGSRSTEIEQPPLAGQRELRR